jgi:hypothetical protein
MTRWKKGTYTRRYYQRRLWKISVYESDLVYCKHYEVRPFVGAQWALIRSVSMRKSDGHTKSVSHLTN